MKGTDGGLIQKVVFELLGKDSVQVLGFCGVRVIQLTSSSQQNKEGLIEGVFQT